MKKNKKIETKIDIRQQLDKMRVVNTHDHLGFSLARVRRPPMKGMEMDLPKFLSGRVFQKASPGLLARLGIMSSLEKYEYLKKPLSEDESEERWKELNPYLEYLRNTIRYRYNLIAFRDLYGFEDDEIDDSNWKKLSLRIRDKSRNRLEWSLEILDKMNLYKVILDNKGWMPNDEIIKDNRLVQGVKMDQFIRGWTNLQALGIPKKKVRSLDEYLNFLDQAFEAAIEAGAVGIKSVMAASRILFFDDVAKSDAERVFSKGINKVGSKETKLFQDFMMHEVCERCAKYNLPFQIHTGLQAGGYNVITNANPTHLTNLFMKFSKVCFILFHGGYPYTQEAGIMAKYFPNVYVNGCWLPQISPTAYKRALDEWLEILPSSKIFAWGGDNMIIDESYASLMLAKDLVSEVLANKISSGYFSKKNALFVAEKIMGGNAIEVFNL